MEWPKDMLEEIEDLRSERSIRSLKVLVWPPQFKSRTKAWIHVCFRVSVQRGDRET